MHWKSLLFYLALLPSSLRLFSSVLKIAQDTPGCYIAHKPKGCIIRYDTVKKISAAIKMEYACMWVDAGSGGGNGRGLERQRKRYRDPTERRGSFKDSISGASVVGCGSFCSAARAKTDLSSLSVSGIPDRACRDRVNKSTLDKLNLYVTHLGWAATRKGGY